MKLNFKNKVDIPCKNIWIDAPVIVTVWGLFAQNYLAGLNQHPGDGNSGRITIFCVFLGRELVIPSIIIIPAVGSSSRKW
jgi:hypothetical protein